MVSLAGSALTAFRYGVGGAGGLGIEPVSVILRAFRVELGSVRGSVQEIAASSQLEIDHRSVSIPPNLCEELWPSFLGNLDNLGQCLQERFRQRLSAKVALSGQDKSSHFGTAERLSLGCPVARSSRVMMIQWFFPAAVSHS